MTLNNLDNVRETGEISAAIIDVPSEDKRVAVVEQVPALVTHQKSTGDEILLTIDIPAENGKNERIAMSINKNDGTVQTDSASVVILAVEKEKTKIKIITTEPVVTKKGKTKERVKSVTIMGLIMALLCMWGKPTQVCQVTTVPVETSNTQLSVITPQPHHIFLPELNPLGVQGPLTLANMEILHKMENRVGNILNLNALEKIKAAKDAFKFGSVVENTRNENIISAIKSDISNLKKNVTSTMKEKNALLDQVVKLRDENTNLSGDVLKMNSTIFDLQKDYAFLNQTENSLRNELRSEQNRGENQNLIIKELENTVLDKDGVITDLRGNLTTLHNTVRNQNDVILDLTEREQNALNMTKTLIQANHDLQKNITKLEELNITDQEQIDALRTLHKHYSDMIDDLSQDIDNGIRYHEGEIRLLKTENDIATRAAHDTGLTNIDRTPLQERENVITQHQVAIQTLKDGKSQLLRETYAKGHKEMSDIFTGQTATLQQKLTFTNHSLDTFFQWAAPHIRVIRLPNGKYEVNYNVEHVSKISPLLKDYISDLSEQFEKELNGGKNNPLTVQPVIDLKVTQRVVFNNDQTGQLSGILTNPSKYQMVLVGSSTTADGPQSHEYLPINVQDIAPYKELLDKAASVSITTVTTTMTTTKTEIPPTVTATATPESITIIKENLVTLPPQTTTVTQYVTSTGVTATPSPFTETVTQTATVTETPSVTTVTATETTTSTVTPTPVETTVYITKDAQTHTILLERTVTEKATKTETVVEQSTVTPSPTSSALFIETPTTTSLSTTTQTTTIVSSSPDVPNVTIQTVISPNRNDAISNIKNGETESKVSVGETGETTVVKTETNERISCFGGAGKFGVILKRTLFCVDDVMNRIDMLKTARRTGSIPPFKMTPLEEAYLKHKSSHPFVNDAEVVTKMQIDGKNGKHANWLSMHAWLNDDSDNRSMTDMMEDEPDVFNRLTFFKMKELEDIYHMRTVKEHWLWGKQYEKSTQELEFYKNYGETGGQAIPLSEWFSDVLRDSDQVSGKIDWNHLNTEPGSGSTQSNHGFTSGRSPSQKIPVYSYAPGQTGRR